MENVWSSKDGDNTADEKLTNEDLYNEQIELLKTFLKNGAITEAQYHKSADALTAKMKH
ncbi:MAG: hypothetical protein KBH85_04260 [Lachnospiraceae bacterium]|jgi:hypothetical protein|nr:hypothetical protein [Lachnospiraceae bacterium]